jgi:hypothetical protein
MAIVNDYRPQAGLAHMDMRRLEKLADIKIEHWDGETEEHLAERTRAWDYSCDWLLIVADRSDRHLMPPSGGRGGLRPTPGVMIAGFYNGDAQLHRFLLAQPTVTDGEVNEVVRQFEHQLRPAVELAARVKWASELATLVQIDTWRRRFPSAADVHTLRFQRTTAPLGRVVERMNELEAWLATDVLYPPA